MFTVTDKLKKIARYSMIAGVVMTLGSSLSVQAQTTTTTATASCNSKFNLQEPTFNPTTKVFSGGTPKAATCGNGVLDPNECCDLGNTKNGIDTDQDGKTDHGCHSNCSQDTKGGWTCNDPAEGFAGYATWVGGMNKLYAELIKANDTTGLVTTKKCNSQPGTNGRDDSGTPTFKDGNELLGSVVLTTCSDYERALDRFRSYNKSHNIDVSVYQKGKIIGYRGNNKNYNQCIANTPTAISSAAASNILGVYINTITCP